MSLKTPLFLISIVGSLCIIIFLIWPSFKEISDAQKGLKEAQAVAAGIQQKNANMNGLIASLNDSKNLDQKEFAFSYIPLEKREELIFNSLSRIASSEGVNVVLGGTSLVMQKEVKIAEASEMPQSSKDVVFGGGTDAAGIETPSVALPSEKIIKANVLVMGKYENIKNFVEKLYALDMLKNISGANLTSVEGEGGSASENISANIVADFVYVPEAKIFNDYNSPIFGKERFNFAILDQVKALLSQKAAAVTVDGTGKNNPFLP